MAYDFYWISGSPNAWRAMLTLEYKGVSYVSHRIDPSKGEHKAPEFLALNPRGKVPVIRDGDAVVHESIAIMAMLERAHPEMPLFGEDAFETGLIWQRVLETINYTRNQVEDGVVRALFRGVAQSGPERLKQDAETAREALQWIEDTLERSPYLAGERLSAADVAAVTTLKTLEKVGRRQDAIDLSLGFGDLAAAYPAIDAWFARMERMPGWDAAYPPHWKR